MLRTELIESGGVKGAKGHDLMVVLHGLGDSMEGYRWVPKVLGASNLDILLVDAPDPYYQGFSWYDIDGNCTPGVERSYGLLEKLLNQLQEKGYASDRTVLFGFSQGCLMCMETGIRYAKRLAGIIGISGYVHQPERLLKQASPVAREQRFLVTHGTYDALIPIDQVRGQYQALKDHGLQIDFHEYPKDHTICEAEIGLISGFIRQRLGPA